MRIIAAINSTFSSFCFTMHIIIATVYWKHAPEEDLDYRWYNFFNHGVDSLFFLVKAILLKQHRPVFEFIWVHLYGTVYVLWIFILWRSGFKGPDVYRSISWKSPTQIAIIYCAVTILILGYNLLFQSLQLGFRTFFIKSSQLDSNKKWCFVKNKLKNSDCLVKLKT